MLTINKAIKAIIEEKALLLYGEFYAIRIALKQLLVLKNKISQISQKWFCSAIPRQQSKPLAQLVKLYQVKFTNVWIIYESWP